MNDKNYYMTESIGDSGVADTKNPLYLSDKYQPFELSPRKRNIGDLFTNDSQYDETLGDVQEAIEEGLTVDDLRARKQSGWAMAGNALLNNIVIAGTTAIGGAIGLVDGILEAVSEGDVGKLWDNEINNWAVQVQENTREAFPIYRGKEYENKSLFGKMRTGVFWADLVQNLGFTEGMLIPGIGMSRLLNSAPKIVRGFIPSLTSSIGEASIEAINARNDEVNNKIRIANQRYNEIASNIETPFALGVLDSEYRKTIADIGNDASNAGNFVFGSNIALLTMSNSIQFGSLFSRGFGTAKRLKGALRRKGNQYFTQGLGLTMAKATGKKLLDATSEGMEEVSQAAISATPSNFEDFNTFNESMFNPEKRELVANLWSAFGKTYAETMRDPQTAVEFASGFIIGAFGVPILRKSKIPVTLENNIGLELRDAYNDWKKRSQQADNINARLAEDKKINSYYNGLVRHLSLQDRMNAALDREDTFDYKNAESAQFISDIMMFDDAGDIDNLKNIINSSIDMSDKGIDAIIEETTKDGEGPFVQNGNRMSREQVRNILQEKIQVLNYKIDSYVKDKEALERSFPNIPEEAVKNALFLKQQIRDYQERFDSVSDKAWSGVINLIQAENTKPETKKKIKKGEGIYVTMPDGTRKLVRKSSIEYFNEDGTPVFKDTPKKDLNLSKEDFLNNWITDVNFRKNIAGMLNDKSSAVPYDTRKEIADTLKDISRLYSIIQVYNRNLADILSNPERASEITAKNIQKAKDTYRENAIADIKDLLLEAKSVRDIQGVLSNLDDTLVPYIDDALDSIINGDNEELSTIVKNYNDLSGFESALFNIIDKIPDEESDLRASLANIVSDAFKDVNSKEEAEAILNSAIDKLPPDLSKNLKRVLDKARNNLSSKKASTEKDSNKPEKKVKKKSGFSLSSAPSNMDEVGDIDNKDNEGEEGRTDRNVSRKPEIEKELEGRSVTELEDISKGKVPEGTPKEEATKVRKLAGTMAKNKRLPKADGQAEGTNSEDNNPIKERTGEPYLRSWYHTKYRFDELKDRNVRRAERYNSPIVDALDELGAYDFVDEGKLGLLFDSNPDIPIYYVKVKDSRLKDVVVLAVRVTPEVQRLTSPTTAFEGQDGNRYQAVGALGFDPKNSKAVRGFRNIISNFNDEYEKYLDNNSEPQFFVAQNQTNKIKHIYSGRMVKTLDENSPRQKPLANITGNRPVLGIYYGNRLRVPMLDDQQEIVPLNSNNVNPRDGSVWLMSREADGRWYAKAVKVKRFTLDEYDVTEHYDTPIMRQILEDLRILADPEQDIYDRSIAKYDLMNLLYFPEGTEILFNKNTVSISGLENDIGAGLDVEEKVQAILNALQDESLNLRFQVDPSQLSEELYIKDLLDSDILTTDLAMAHNVNASFDLFITDAEGSPQGEAVRPKGHTGRKGINNAIASRTLTLNGAEYSITENEVRDSKGDVITDPYTIEELSLLQKIEEGSINPVEGSNRLFLGVHAMTGQQFGISGGHVITGEKLDKLLENARKKADKAERKVEANALLEQASNENLARLIGLDETETEAASEPRKTFSISNLPETQPNAEYAELNKNEPGGIEEVLMGLLDRIKPLPSKGSQFYELNLGTATRVRGEIMKGKKERYEKDKNGNYYTISSLIEEINNILHRIDDVTETRNRRASETKGELSQDESLRGPEAMLEVLRNQAREALSSAFYLLNNKVNSFGELKESKPSLSFSAPSESNLGKLEALKSEEESEATKKPKIISDTFIKGNTPTLKELNEKKDNPNFQRLAKSNRRALADLGFKSVSELEDLLKDPEYAFPSIETIDTQEKFDAVLDMIKNCRKLGNKWGF